MIEHESLAFERSKHNKAWAERFILELRNSRWQSELGPSHIMEHYGDFDCINAAAAATVLELQTFQMLYCSFDVDLKLHVQIKVLFYFHLRDKSVVF